MRLLRIACAAAAWFAVHSGCLTTRQLCAQPVPACSGGGSSHLYLVMARTGEPGPKGISAFLIEKVRLGGSLQVVGAVWWLVAWPQDGRCHDVVARLESVHSVLRCPACPSAHPCLTSCSCLLPLLPARTLRASHLASQSARWGGTRSPQPRWWVCCACKMRRPVLPRCAMLRHAVLALPGEQGPHSVPDLFTLPQASLPYFPQLLAAPCRR